jgi:anthranilate phosphoribosyltransferase
MSIQTTLRRIVEYRETLKLVEASGLMRDILAGAASDVELAGLLGALAGRGETAAELAGFAVALREAATPLPLTAAEQAVVVDTCGTGGDASGSFNISTAAALVAAAAGARVAKHGNRAITSRCGSADVLEALGIPVTLSPPAAADALREHNFCFLLAPAHHPALHAVMPVRRALGVRTILHVLGPLLNPAGARRQVMGVYSKRLVALVAEAMTLLPIDHALVVHGESTHGESTMDAGALSERAGIDEISLSGPTHIAEVKGRTVTQTTLTPELLHLPTSPLEALTGGDAAFNAQLLTQLFAGEKSPRRDIVLANAAAVLHAAGLAPTLTAGIPLAAAALDEGRVAELVRNLQQ